MNDFPAKRARQPPPHSNAIQTCNSTRATGCSGGRMKPTLCATASFTDAEIDTFVTHAADRAQLVDRFNADGPNDDLNCYLVFRRL